MLENILDMFPSDSMSQNSQIVTTQLPGKSLKDVIDRTVRAEQN